MIYTSYWGNMKTLLRDGIEPISVSRGKPKNYCGRMLDTLAPTWNMLKMNTEDYDNHYEKILQANDAKEIVKWIGEKDVALLCWEKNPEECHRSKIAKWLNQNGYECEEYGAVKKEGKPEIQLALF